MKKEGDIKRRYQHPDAVSYTPESKDGLMLLIKPSFSFFRTNRSDTSEQRIAEKRQVLHPIRINFSLAFQKIRDMSKNEPPKAYIFIRFWQCDAEDAPYIYIFSKRRYFLIIFTVHSPPYSILCTAAKLSIFNAIDKQSRLL